MGPRLKAPVGDLSIYRLVAAILKSSLRSAGDECKDCREFPLQNTENSLRLNASSNSGLNLGGTTSALVPMRTVRFFDFYIGQATIKDMNAYECHIREWGPG
ncbi:hypothetical protein GCM10010913_26810 [Paenibacillus aceti]|uniref:Uncharacterized protein n=1 Tax=Paenibacillus aceti TaxID=1820010 RepID=A0ABQ1VXP8_9BACL|nr:hypothetical protein GCM10010913_26810 [Paenibacillus aceti]